MAEAAVEPQPTLLCAGSTGDTYRCTVDYAHPGWADAVYGAATIAHKQESNCFRHALLSSDGTAVVTYNEDLILRTFAVPFVHIDEKPVAVSPHYSAPSPLKLSSLTLHPAFDVSNYARTLLLTSQHDLPIRLTNAFDVTHTHASYTWQNRLTEAYISPSSLRFSSNTRFVAGATDTIAVFDLNHMAGPIHESRTNKGRKAKKNYGANYGSIGGIVSALAVSRNNLLAAGTYNRQVAMYENAGYGERTNAIDLRLHQAEDSAIKGNGVCQLEWSDCGRYIFVAERQSDVLLVYDIRKPGTRLSYMTGRHAFTTLKLSFDVDTTHFGTTDIWAGGSDGKVRIWQNVTAREGALKPASVMDISQAAVSNTIVSRLQSMVITTSGQRRKTCDLLDLSDSDSDSGSGSESSRESGNDNEEDSGESDSGSCGKEQCSGETPASAIASHVAVPESWRGPAFDNVLSFWHVT